jgi:TPR repeat protein
MKAAVFRKAKSGKVLEMKDLEQPVPKDNEVVLRVRAASVNPLDWRMKTERPGVDVAGEVEALRWFIAAAEQGHPVAQVNLGQMYENGHGVPLNYIEAYKWFSLAADQGFRSGTDARQSIATIMTKQQLNAAEASVSEWQRQHQPQAEKLAVASSAQREAQSSKRANGPVRPR